MLASRFIIRTAEFTALIMIADMKIEKKIFVMLNRTICISNLKINDKILALSLKMLTKILL
jgi:hypothetical protein